MQTAAEAKAKVEALSAIGKHAPRLGEGVRIVRQHNKRPTTRAGRAELKGKKRAFWGAMVMLPEAEAPPETPPEMEYDAAGASGTMWSDMTDEALNPISAMELQRTPRKRPMGSGASRQTDNSVPGSADQAAMALAMLSGQNFPEPARAPPPQVPHSRPAGTHALGQRPTGQPPMAQRPPGPPPMARPTGQRPQGIPVMDQRQGMPVMQRGPGGPPMPAHGYGTTPQLQYAGGPVPHHAGGLPPRYHGPPHGPRSYGAPNGAPLGPPHGPLVRVRVKVKVRVGLGPNPNPNPNLTRSAAVRSAAPCAALARGGHGSAAGEGPRRHSLPQDPLARDPDRGDQLRWELWDDVAVHSIANRRLRGHLRTVLLRCAWTCGMWALLSRRHGGTR